MFCRILYLFCSMWAISTALNPTQVASFFYVSPGNTINQPLIQTQNNAISYTVEIVGGGVALAPQFLSINLKTGDATRILDDTLVACGQNNATYSRIFYHAGQSTLVYYCTRNNSLLILDENTYTVTDAIAAQVTGQFNETKITAEGDSVVILGIETPFTTNPTAAQLIKINLSTKQVVRQVTFDIELDNGEVLTSYASSGLLSFVLTSQVNASSFTTTITIYSVIFIGNTYKLTQVSTFSYGMPVPLRTSELYIIGSYFVTNDYQDLLFINIQGGISQRFADLAFLQQTMLKPTNSPYGAKPDYFEVPNYAVGNDVYAHFLNQTVLQISSSGLVLTSNFITNATEVHMVVGNDVADDLLFTITGPALLFQTAGIQFSVLNAITGLPLYDSYNFYTDLYLTNNSYIITDYAYGVVNRKTNIFTASLPNVSDTSFESYYEPVNQVLYYVDYDRSLPQPTSCTVKWIQPDTQETGEVLTVDVGIMCGFGTFVYLKAGTDKTQPDFVLNLRGYFIIYSFQYGYVDYVPVDFPDLIVPNFQDLSLYEVSVFPDTKTAIISNYTHNGTTFSLQKTYTLNNVPIKDFPDYLVLDGDTVAVYDNEEFAIISLSEGTFNTYNVPFNVSFFTGFQDNLNQSYVIMVNQSYLGDLNTIPPYIFGPDKVPAPLPEADGYTLQAGGAGSCTYWIEQGYVTSFGVARFYDICSQSRQQENKYELYDIDMSIIS